MLSQLNAMECDMKKIRSHFWKLGVKVSWAGERAIFTARDGVYDQLTSEANGLVALKNGETWEVLYTPPRTMKTRIDAEYVGANMDSYEIFEAVDGTRIGLYWYKDSWRICTINGYDVTELTWSGKTYRDTLAEVTDEKFYENLDKEQSYTFIFRHPDFHPCAEKTDIWFVQRALKSGEVLYDLPNMDIHGLPPATNCARLPFLFRKLRPALGKYLSKKGELWGYTMRAKSWNDVPFEQQHLLLESSLLINVRRMIYSKNISQMSKGCDRMTYITVRAACTDNELFLQLFPRFATLFREVCFAISELVKAVCTRYRGRAGDLEALEELKGLKKSYAIASEKAIKKIIGHPTLTVHPLLWRDVLRELKKPKFTWIICDLMA